MISITNIQEAFNRAKGFFVEGCEFYYVTSDGNVFLQENKNFATNHARKLKCEVFEVEKSKVEEPIKKKRGRKKISDGTTTNNI